MSLDSFWLVELEDGSARVSLTSLSAPGFSTLAYGELINASPSVNDSLTMAVDQSLSQAAANAHLSQSQEPSSAAFVLNPFWIGQDGKIIPAKLKLIEAVCHKLKLKALGFISYDEAVVEDLNRLDGFPPSFILIKGSSGYFTLSLVYLGKIKERIHKILSTEFTPKVVEDSLIELNSPSTLPPQILLHGDLPEAFLKDLQDYPWIGKKNIETFLHFPEIKLLELPELVSLYNRVIISQINLPNQLEQTLPASDLPAEFTEDAQAEPDIPKPEPLPPATLSDIVINQVPPSEFGYYSPQEELPPMPVAKPLPVLESLPPLPEKTKISLPKISIPRPKFHFQLNKKFALSFALVPLLLLVPVFLSSAKITLFLTPIGLSKEFPIILDPQSDKIDYNKKTIPVTQKNISVSANVSAETTGEKIVGDKAKGEIVVFNKQDKTQNIPKGSIITDIQGRKFELLNIVSIASSSSNLDQGVITLGQTKTIVQALEIGPEYNIDKDAKLFFKDYSENQIVAKTSQTFVGGSKNQLKAVSEADIKSLNEKIKQAISTAVTKKVNDDLANLSGALQDTIKIKQQKIEFSREVGEVADELVASVDAQISILIFDPTQSKDVISTFLADDSGFKQSVFEPDKINLNFKISSPEDTQTKALLTLSGQLLPKIDSDRIKIDLKGKSLDYARKYLQNKVERVYDYSINTNLPLLEFINPLPFRPQSININVQSEQP
ncbi:MAG: hypothetical protein WC686_00760 [Candidatus Shapirobacteria bacterium]|jgi:hypothetical protein